MGDESGETFSNDLKVQMGRLWSKVTQEASDTATVQSREADPSLSKTLPDWDMGPPTEWTLVGCSGRAGASGALPTTLRGSCAHSEEAPLRTGPEDLQELDSLDTEKSLLCGLGSR